MLLYLLLMAFIPLLIEGIRYVLELGGVGHQAHTIQPRSVGVNVGACPCACTVCLFSFV